MKGRRRIGEMLVGRGVLTEDQLRAAVEGQRRSGNRLASECFAAGVAGEAPLLATLSLQVGVPGVRIADLALPLGFLDNVPASVARKHTVLPVKVDAERIFLAMADVRQGQLVDELTFVCQRTVVCCVALAGPLSEAIEAAYAAKARGELEYRGARAEEAAPVGELQLVHADEMTRVPPELLPPGGGEAEEIPFDLALDQDLDPEELPIGAAELLQTELAESGPPEARPRDDGPRALVVDDDQEQARLVAKLLTAKGFSVETVHRGLAALNRIKAEPPDLLVLDAMLPEVHGFDIVRKLKRSERYRHIPVVMVSSAYRGWRIAEDLKESYRVEAFVEKPFKLDDLWATVERVIAQRQGRRRRMVSSAFRSYQEGMRRFEAEDLDGAIERVEEAVRSDPLSSKLHFALGVLLLKKRGRVYQAMHALEQAVLLDPTHFGALRSLAVLYQKKGFKNKAIEMWERSLRCSPDDKTAEKVREHLLTLL